MELTQPEKKGKLTEVEEKAQETLQKIQQQKEDWIRLILLIGQSNPLECEVSCSGTPVSSGRIEGLRRKLIEIDQELSDINTIKNKLFNILT